MDEAQLLKGILEGCVLGIIQKGETYGYEILSEFEKAAFKDDYIDITNSANRILCLEEGGKEIEL